MSDETTNETNESTEVETSEETPTIESLQKEVEKWKGLSRKNETAKKTALDERDALQAQLTEATQTVASLKEIGEVADGYKSQISELQEKLDSAQVENVRLGVARKHQLGDDLVEFLTAQTEEGLAEQAEKLSRLSTPPSGNSHSDNLIIQSEGRGATPLNSDALTDKMQSLLGY